MHYIDKYIHFIDTPIKNNLIFDELQLVKKTPQALKLRCLTKNNQPKPTENEI
jgi:hypothetical protein